MESAACRRRASDAEQSARWSYSATAERESAMVKEEPEWGECGASEAAVAEGLYAGHEVKDEIEIGPEVIQPQDIVYSLQNAACRPEDSPNWLKIESGTDASDCTYTCPWDDCDWSRNTERKYDLRSCFVECLPEDQHQSNPCNSVTGKPSASGLRRRGQECKRCDCNLPSLLKRHRKSALNRAHRIPRKLKPAAWASPACARTRPGACRCSSSRKQQSQLSSCSVRLERILIEDLTCTTCLATFDSKSSLKIHSCTLSMVEPNLYEAHEETVKTCFRCDDCGEQYLQKKHLVKHLITHVKPGSAILSQHLTDTNSIVNTEETHSYYDSISNTQYRNSSVLASHTAEKPSLLQCDTCNKCFTSRKSWTIHLRSHTKKNGYSCDTCNKDFVHLRTLTKHKLIHSDEKPFSFGIVSHTTEELLSCDLCHKAFSQKDNLIRHIQSHTVEKPFASDVCKSRFVHKSKLTQHRRIHSGEKPFACDFCNSRFVRKSNLNRHRRIHSGEKPFACDVCKSRFVNKCDLTPHRRIHSGEKPFACDVCKSRFAQKSNLDRHRRIHSGEKPFACDVCNSRFVQRSYLNVHKRIHTGEKPFACDVCKSRFVDKSNLTKHKLIHSGEKPFACDFCNSRFVHKSILTRHRLIHSGEKSFVCDICKSRFAQKSNLTRHRRIHSGEKPFACDVCNSRFALRSTLNDHRQIHTGEKPFACDVCKSRFAQRIHLNIHKRLHTGD